MLDKKEYQFITQKAHLNLFNQTQSLRSIWFKRFHSSIIVFI